ncbi:MAG TPA: hypothetical protein G4O19_04970 [Dehalococcoidia bacterium]|nr:hypothetical protein [Dehalococcoidia bacterium]
MENNNKWADTTPIAIFIVGGILIGCFWPMLVGYITLGASPLIAGVIIASSIVFITLMVIDIRGGNLFGATLNGVFGVLLGLAPGLMFLLAFLAQGMGIQVDMRVIGWYFFYIAPVLLVVGFIAGGMFWHMAIALWALAIDVFLIGMVFAGYLSHSWEPALGWVIFAGGIYFFYMAAGAFMAGVMRRPVLPMGGPLFKVNR